MKYLIASDIHGSAFFLEKLLSAYEEEKPEKIILLGDILYHGPRNDLPKGYNPKKVIELLNAKKDEIICVHGNCDAEVDQMVLSFPIMDDFKVLEAGKRKIFITHGHRYNLEKLPPLTEGEILLHGHTHIPASIPFGKDNFYLNPGSVSIPKENSENGYMTFEDGVFSWKTLEGKTYKTLSL